ncbi:lymphoid-specific helicase-like isoform X2 [Mya arenaria]|uniref:lymphoid-specific helicase-like isoform X2 n=1 Tax=Mya arenaria TaxID=6604 RepID=UPI0022E3CBB0|nr:lymphoid-specific helicase-like isoform X2 [Mya arenaria]
MSEVGLVQASPFKPDLDNATMPEEDAASRAGSDVAVAELTASRQVDSPLTVASVQDSEQSVQGNELITQSEVDEEARLEQEREQEDKEEYRKRKEMWLHLEQDSKEQRYERLKVLLMKSNMYTEYLLQRMERQKALEMKKRDAMLKKLARDREKREAQDANKAKTNAAVLADHSQDTENSQKSTESNSSRRSTRGKMSLRAPVPKSKLSAANSPAITPKSRASPSTPGMIASSTPNIKGAKEALEPSLDETSQKADPSEKDSDRISQTTVPEEGVTKPSEKDTEMTEKDTEMTENDTEMTEKDSELSEKDTKLSEKDSEMKVKDNEMPEEDRDGSSARDQSMSPGSEKENDTPQVRRSGRVKVDAETQDTKSKRGRKRKSLNYNEKSPQGAKLLTHFFTPSSKRQKLVMEADQEDDDKEEEEMKEEKKDPNAIDLFTGFPDIEPDGTITRPALLTGGKLRNYQVEGLNWLKVLFENGVNGILADEMGLGKTIQCVALMCQIVTMGALGPFIVIAPLSTLPNWRNEFKRFAPRLPILFYHGTREERARLTNKMKKKHEVLPGIKIQPIVITSYDIAMRDRANLQRFEWTFMIVDEGHRLKNTECRLLKELKQYKNTHRLLLTGTPLQNNLKELWSLLHFLLPEIFDDLGSFETWFDVTVISDDAADEAIIEEEKKTNILGMLHQILTPFMLRRVKADVDIDIPPKKELIVYAPLSNVQREFYESTVDRTILNKFKTNNQPEIEVDLDAKGRPIRGKGTYKPEKNLFPEAELSLQMRNIMMQLRKVCNHPYLLEYPLDVTGNYLVDEDIVRKCGKMLVLDQMLMELHKDGHKVLIFSQFTTMMDILGDYLYMRKIEHCRLDGNTKVEDRQIAMDEFNTDPDKWVFLLSTRAGGLGINLIGADTVIIYDSDWNPQNDLQAQDRCHRIGQTKPVMVYRFVTANTIDQKIVERAAGKRKLEKMIIHKGKFKRGIDKDFTSEVKPLCPEELWDLLKSRDHSNVVKEMKDGEVMSKEDMQALLDRSELMKEFEENMKARKGQARC